jgi:hypothetical protein
MRHNRGALQAAPGRFPSSKKQFEAIPAACEMEEVAQLPGAGSLVSGWRMVIIAWATSAIGLAYLHHSSLKHTQTLSLALRMCSPSGWP